MTKVEFAVSFRLGEDGATERMFGGAVRDPSETPHVSELERGEKGRADIGAIGTAVWMEGVARSYDVRNKVLFIDANDRGSSPGTAGGATRPTTDCNREAEIGNTATSARNQPTDEEQHDRSRTEGGQRRCGYYARHVLDVILLSCLSSQGEELFDQLRTFACAFKTGLVRASLDVAVDAAADLGAACRVVFGEFVFEIVKEGVATEAYRSERLAVAAKSTATAAVGSVLRAAQRAVILAQRLASGKAACRRNLKSAAVVNNNGTGEARLPRMRTSISIKSVENSTPHAPGESSGDSLPGHDTIVVDKSVAARMLFRCTAIVRERRRKVPRSIVAASVAGVGGEDVANSGVMHRRRQDLQYLARWT